MKLGEFNSLVGMDSYVRCQGKERIDPAIVNQEAAERHLFSGGTVGWWVKEGYIVVDIDEGKEQAKAIVKKMGLKTLMAETNKGLHLYFKVDKDYPQKIGMVLPCGLKCDYRVANKGYVLLPFGVEGRRFNKVKEIADMPLEWTPIPTRKDSLLDLKEGGGRNQLLFNQLISYKNRGASEAQIEEMGNIINEMVFGEPMEAKELQKVIDSVGRYEARPEGENPYLIYNAKGAPSQVNARAIADYFVNKGDIFVIGGECFQYREGRYVEASSYVRNAIKEMINVDSLITHSRIMEVYRLLIDDTRIQKEASELNENNNLINFANGVWDIEKKELLPHDSKYLQTIQIPHDVEEANCKWEETKIYKFLSEECQLAEEDIEMAATYMAYCMTLDFGLKTFMILQGQSNTGKSVLIRFFETLVGQMNTSALSLHELNMRFYPSQLYGRLVNACADNSSLPLSSIDNLKKITGGDQIMHEKKGKEPFFFVPFAKLLFSFNQMPLQLEEKSNAFYLRMRILYMNKALSLNGDYVDALCSEDSIKETIPHLLNRLPLKAVPRTATSDRLIEALRQDSDSIHAFISDKCEISPKVWITKKALYDAYVKFCMDNGREAHKKHSFMRHMRGQGFREVRHPKSREYCWKGLTFKK